MCKEGLMERFGIQEVYGMHNWPGRPVGSFAIRPGAFFAATDQFDITLEGREYKVDRSLLRAIRL